MGKKKETPKKLYRLSEVKDASNPGLVFKLESLDSEGEKYHELTRAGYVPFGTKGCLLLYGQWSERGPNKPFDSAHDERGAKREVYDKILECILQHTRAWDIHKVLEDLTEYSGEAKQQRLNIDFE